MVAGQSLGDEGGWLLSKRRCEALSVCECELLIVLVSKRATPTGVYRLHTNPDTNQYTLYQHVCVRFHALYYISVSLLCVVLFWGLFLGKTY